MLMGVDYDIRSSGGFRISLDYWSEKKGKDLKRLLFKTHEKK
jgi:hypothetical protein